MDTTVTAGRTAGGDLTAKARIRNAALELHAAKGSDNTTLRDVASAAGVTSGLVIHHFGSKDGLRRAVQQYVVDQFRQAVDSVPPVGTPEEIGRARDEAVARHSLDHHAPALLDALVPGRRGAGTPERTDRSARL